MGIYKLLNKAEEIQETTMTDPLEQAISWEWFKKIQNILYQSLKLYTRNITNNTKFSVIKGLFLMHSWQTFVCISRFFSHERHSKWFSSLRDECNYKFWACYLNKQFAFLFRYSFINHKKKNLPRKIFFCFFFCYANINKHYVWSLIAWTTGIVDECEKNILILSLLGLKVLAAILTRNKVGWARKPF